MTRARLSPLRLPPFFIPHCGLVLLVLLVQMPPAYAQHVAARPSNTTGNLTQPAPDIPHIKSIRVFGLDRTRRSVVDRELEVREGEPFDREKLQASVQNLRDLGLFYEVAAESTASEQQPDQVDLHFTVAEKWTTIPIARFGGGGGSSFFVLGLYELNSFGRHIELGGQYENHNGAHSGVVWWGHKRLFGSSVDAKLNVGLFNRSHTLYARNPEPIGAYFTSTRRVESELRFPLTGSQALVAGGRLFADETTNSLLSGEEKRLNEEGQGFSWQRQTRVQPLVGHQWGRLRSVGIHTQGQLLETRISGSFGPAPQRSAQESALPNRDHFQAESELRAFALAGQRHNFALRLRGVVSGAEHPADQVLWGGVGDIRGFPDGFLRGNRAALANMEYRVPSLQFRYFVLKHVVFYDVAQVGQSAEDFARSRPAQSAGTGLRFIAPSVARLTVRLDYAVGWSPYSTQGVAFGMQHFF